MGLGRDRIEERMTGLCWYIHVWSNFKGRQFELGGFLCFFGKHSNVQGSRTIFFLDPASCPGTRSEGHCQGSLAFAAQISRTPTPSTTTDPTPQLPPAGTA